MNYSEWKPGDPAPAGYKISTYVHCEHCQGHDYLEAIEDPSRPRMVEAKIFRPLRTTSKARSYQAEFREM